MNYTKNVLSQVLLFSTILMIVVGTACNISSSKSSELKAVVPIQEDPPAIIIPESDVVFDSSIVETFLTKYPLLKVYSKQYDTLYHSNNFNYIWFDKNGLRETTNKLLAHINELETEGVRATVPYHDEFYNMLQLDSANDNRGIHTELELMLTGQYFNYVKKVYAGAVSDKLETIKWYIPAKKFSYVELLENNLKTGNIDHEGNATLIPQYEKLKKYLGEYREIEKKLTTETTVPAFAKGVTVKPNDSSSVIPLLKKRLAQLGMFEAKDSSSRYNAALVKAVNDAKTSYGLKSDTLITKALISQLNVPIRKRIEQIMVNMERFRWMPRDTVSNEFILVNIPEYTLHYFEKNKQTWTCKVVVGKQMTKTVIFSGKMQYVVFSPYWNIPSEIIRKEIKPSMARNRNYLAAHRMEWNGGNIRQLPGPTNSLGLVKFLFPNSNNIYLHDTPSKSLFNNDNRAFSHGCIRVNKPRDLAIRILKQDPYWTEEKIDSAMHAGKEKFVTLKNKIPVYIGYFTAFVGSDGSLQFRDDIYSLDEKLLKLLNQ